MSDLPAQPGTTATKNVTDSRVAKCRECAQVFPLGDMVEVTNRATGEVRYLCRPAFSHCFGNSIRDRDTETIAAPHRAVGVRVDTDRIAP